MRPGATERPDLTAHTPPMVPSHADGRTATYLGASEDELRVASDSRRVLAVTDQRRLFPHQGTLTLTPEAIDLRGWRTLTPTQVTTVELTFTPLYSRWIAGGVRGRNASFGLFGSLGKPIVLSLLGEAPLYLLIDFRWLTGINKARAWAPRIAIWATGAQTRPLSPCTARVTPPRSSNVITAKKLSVSVITVAVLTVAGAGCGHLYITRHTSPGGITHTTTNNPTTTTSHG